jgi:hypothetical protein
MKKGKDLVLKTTTDIKVFLLFILDNVGHPIDHTTVLSIVEENTDDISLDHGECLRQLVASEHLIYDEVDGEGYYMISDKGRIVSAELYESLDPELRERSLRSANKHVTLAGDGSKIEARIEQTPNKRFKVILDSFDKQGEVMSLSVVVSTRDEAELIKKNFESRPGSIYRGILFSLTGKLEFFS